MDAGLRGITKQQAAGSRHSTEGSRQQIAVSALLGSALRVPKKSSSFAFDAGGGAAWQVSTVTNKRKIA